MLWIIEEFSNKNWFRKISFSGHVLEFVVEPSDTVVQAGHSAVLDCVSKSDDFPTNTLNIQWLDKDLQTLTFIGDSYRYVFIKQQIKKPYFIFCYCNLFKFYYKLITFLLINLFLRPINVLLLLIIPNNCCNPINYCYWLVCIVTKVPLLEMNLL